jgi:hypothetical protein
MDVLRRFPWALAVLVGMACLGLMYSGTAAMASEVPVVDRYAAALASANSRLPPSSRHNLAERLLLLSSYYQIDPRLLLAVVSVESNWRPGAISPVGAAGYGQLMPATAASLKVQSLEPYENLDGTARYLRRMIMLHASADPVQRVRLAAASYNAGPYAVQRFGGVPPYRETRNYVVRVVSEWRRFSAMLAAPSSSDVSTLVARAEPVRLYPARARTVGMTHGGRPLTFASTVLRQRRLTTTARHVVRLASKAERQREVVMNWRPAERPTPVVRYETSRSFVARFLGMKHRVVESAPTPSPSGAWAGSLTSTTFR